MHELKSDRQLPHAPLSALPADRLHLSLQHWAPTVHDAPSWSLPVHTGGGPLSVPASAPASTPPELVDPLLVDPLLVDPLLVDPPELLVDPPLVELVDGPPSTPRTSGALSSSPASVAQAVPTHASTRRERRRAPVTTSS